MNYILNYDSPGNSRGKDAPKCFPEAQVSENKGRFSFPRSRRGKENNAAETTTYAPGGRGYINIPPLGAGDLYFLIRRPR